MCVIAVKPSNVDIPAEDKLKMMWDKNPDGAGFMYTYDNTVNISKGFMTFEDFKNNLNYVKELVEADGKTLKDIPMIMHFRITTHGGTSPENTHPFPITNKEEHLKALDVKCNMGMAHNGVISSLSREKDVSDTQIYIRDILYDLSIVDKGFVKRFTKIIDLTKGSSRLAFLDKEGAITMFGDFVELDDKDGLYYSNKLFMPYKATTYGGTYYYKSEVKPLITEFNEDDEYEIRTDIELPPRVSKYAGKTLLYVEDDPRYSSYYLWKTFIVEETAATVYIEGEYIQLKPKDKLYSKKDYSNKHNIGGRKNKETYKILQNANRTNYIKNTYKTMKLKKVPKDTILVDKYYIDAMKFGDYAYFDDFKVTVESNNWYYNIADRHYYYKQKDGNLMRIEKDEVYAEVLLDDELNYVGHIEGTISQTYVTFTNVAVYSLKKNEVIVC